MSHSVDGFPVFEFSQAIALAADGTQGANGSVDWTALAEFSDFLSGDLDAETALVWLVNGAKL